jgi:capsular polysaccharide biosynthesis protein
MVGSALKDARVQRDVSDFAANHVAAQRVGESSIVELSVTDQDGAAAGRIAVALSAKVAAFMNNGDRAAFNAARSRLDKEVAAATRRRDQLTVRFRGTAELSAARASLQSQVQSADLLVSQLTTQRATLMVADATRDVVVPIGSTADTRLVQSALLPQAALALLFGLVLGLTAATVLETIRPRVGSVRALARRLQAPVLGKSTEEIESLRNTMALAARRQGVDAVVLMGAEKRDVETVSQLLFVLSGSAPVRQRLKSPSSSRHRIEKAEEDGVFELDEAGGAPFANVRFTELSAVTPQDEMTAGVVVVSAGNVRLRRLDDLDDVLKAVRWPVLGIVHGPARRRFWGRR